MFIIFLSKHTETQRHLKSCVASKPICARLISDYSLRAHELELRSIEKRAKKKRKSTGTFFFFFLELNPSRSRTIIRMRVRILNRTSVLSLGLCSMLLLGAVAGKYASDLHFNYFNWYYVYPYYRVHVTLFYVMLFIRITQRCGMDTVMWSEVNWIGLLYKCELSGLSCFILLCRFTLTEFQYHCQ